MKRFDIGFGFQCGFTVLLIIAVVAVFAVLIIGDIQNENNRIDAGVIVDRKFESGYSYAHADKNSGNFRSTPDTYYFVIEGEKDGETVQYRFEVTAEEYEKYRIGDYYER